MELSTSETIVDETSKRKKQNNNHKNNKINNQFQPNDSHFGDDLHILGSPELYKMKNKNRLDHSLSTVKSTNNNVEYQCNPSNKTIDDRLVNERKLSPESSPNRPMKRQRSEDISQSKKLKGNSSESTYINSTVEIFVKQLPQFDNQILKSFFDEIIISEKQISQSEERETANSPLDNSPYKIGNEKTKRIRYRHYDFSSVLPPKDGCFDSDLEMKLACECLKKIYDICITMRESIQFDDVKLINSINKCISDMELLILTNNSFSELVSCINFYIQILKDLLDLNKNIPFSDRYGNYLSSLVRFYLRKELNAANIVYDQQEDFICVGHLVEIVPNTGRLAYNIGDIAALISRALVDYLNCMDYFNDKPEPPTSAKKKKLYHKKQRLLVSSFSFLHSLFTDPSFYTIYSTKNINWVQLQHYLNYAKNVDNFIDSHLFLLGDIDKLITDLEKQYVDMINLEGFKRYKPSLNEFFYPDLSIVSKDELDIYLSAVGNECPKCQQKCGSIGLEICEECKRGYHEGCVVKPFLQLTTFICSDCITRNNSIKTKI